jgi:hypothetical protein
MKNHLDIPIEAKRYLTKKMIEIFFIRNRTKGISKRKSMQMAFSEMNEIFNKSK